MNQYKLAAALATLWRLSPAVFNSPLKNSQLLRCCKKFKLSRMNNYASTLVDLL
jgi:hypothetical protein